MKNLIKYYEEIPIDELTEDLQEYGVEFVDNQFTEKINDVVKSIIVGRKQFLVYNWLRYILSSNFELLNEEDFDKVLNILTKKNINECLQLEMKQIFENNNLEVLHYISQNGYDYELKNKCGLTLMYSEFIRSDKGKEAVRLVDEYYNI